MGEEDWKVTQLVLTLLRNLLANAIQALAELPAGSERRVTVDAGLEHGKVWIRIADNGPGIAPSIRARLFEPFVTGRANGVGIGLALSRRIARAHGGDLRLVDEGPGATFELSIPGASA